MALWKFSVLYKSLALIMTVQNSKLQSKPELLNQESVKPLHVQIFNEPSGSQLHAPELIMVSIK